MNIENDNNIPIYMDLYPSILENLVIDSEKKIFDEKTNFKIRKNKIYELFDEDKEDIYEMNNVFLDKI